MFGSVCLEYSVLLFELKRFYVIVGVYIGDIEWIDNKRYHDEDRQDHIDKRKQDSQNRIYQ